MTHSPFRRNIDAFDNNTHCIPRAITELSACLFTLFPSNPQDTRGSVEAAQREFLRVASVLLLRLYVSRDGAKNRDGAVTLVNNVSHRSSLHAPGAP